MELTKIAKHFDIRGENAIAEIEIVDEKSLYEKRYQNQMACGLFDFIENHVPAPKERTARFLDLCCGTGAFSIYPAYLGYSIDGVDISEKSIQAARLRLSSHGFDDFSRNFIQADALSFLDGVVEKYDVIQCVASFYYLKDSNALEKIWKALKPGGIFIGVETNGMNPLSAALRSMRHKKLNHRDPATLNNLMKVKDFELMALQFRSFELTPLNLFSFLGLAGRSKQKFAKYLFRAGQFMDRIMFLIPGTYRLAFRMGYLGKK